MHISEKLDLYYLLWDIFYVPFRKWSRWGLVWNCEVDNPSVMKTVCNILLQLFLLILTSFSQLSCDTWTFTTQYFKIILSISEGKYIELFLTDLLKEGMTCLFQLPRKAFGLEGQIALLSVFSYWTFKQWNIFISLCQHTIALDTSALLC